MKISMEWLNEKNACTEGKEWFNAQKETNGKKLVVALMADNHSDWANWLLARIMTHKQQIKYAIYAAEKVLKIYEDKYPNDKRPRLAIEAARTYLKRPTQENKAAAYAAHAAAYAAADAAYAAYATHAAAYAADAAVLKDILNYGLSLIK